MEESVSSSEFVNTPYISRTVGVGTAGFGEVEMEGVLETDPSEFAKSKVKLNLGVVPGVEMAVAWQPFMSTRSGGTRNRGTGDVVLGTIAGILFIPPHLAEECCIRAERTQLRETFQFQRIHEGVYNSHEMDSAWSSEIEADFHEWRKDNTPEHYQHLDFEEDKAAEDQATSDEAGTVL